MMRSGISHCWSWPSPGGEITSGPVGSIPLFESRSVQPHPDSFQHFSIPPTIELGRPGRRMTGHGGGLFQHPGIFEIGGDSSGPERVVADIGARRPSLDRCVSVAFGERCRCQFPGASANRPEKRSFRIAAKAATVDIGVVGRSRRGWRQADSGVAPLL